MRFIVKILGCFLTCVLCAGLALFPSISTEALPTNCGNNELPVAVTLTRIVPRSEPNWAAGASLSFTWSWRSNHDNLESGNLDGTVDFCAAPNDAGISPNGGPMVFNNFNTTNFPGVPNGYTFLGYGINSEYAGGIQHTRTVPAVLVRNLDYSTAELAITEGNKIANGQDQHQLTLTLTDEGSTITGLPSEQVDALLNYSGPDPRVVTQSNWSEVTGSTGVYTRNLTTNTPGTYDFSILNGQRTVSGTWVDALRGVDLAESSAVVSQDPTVMVNENQTVTLTLRNADGALVENLEQDTAFLDNLVRWSTDVTPSATWATSDSGVYTREVTSETAGPVIQVGQPQVENYEPSPFTAPWASADPRVTLDREASNLKVSTGEVIANGVDEHTLTAEMKNLLGEPITGLTDRINIIIELDFDRDSLRMSSFVETSPGIYFAEITTTVPGTYFVGSIIDETKKWKFIPAADRSRIASTGLNLQSLPIGLIFSVVFIVGTMLILRRSKT